MIVHIETEVVKDHVMVPEYGLMKIVNHKNRYFSLTRAALIKLKTFNCVFIRLSIILKFNKDQCSLTDDQKNIKILWFLKKPTEL